jgi:hypothetical protein
MKQPDLARFDPKYKVKPEEVHMQGLPAIETPPLLASATTPNPPGTTGTDKGINNKVETKQDTMTPGNRDTTVPLIDEIRHAVKELGKEAATYRFTKTEKDALKDLVYIYRRQGLKTSENEIARIAINWLFDDNKTSGEQSIIYLVLQALRQ